MDAGQYQLEFEVFQRCLELTGSERATALEEACGSNAELRARVESLLAAASREGADAVSDRQIEARGATRWMGQLADALHVEAPETIGAFRIVGLIGEGGMGQVFEAEQTNPKRRVAVKLIAPQARSTGLMQRFELETDVLARLHHPGIAQIFECGEHDGEHGPQPYFAMELVDGVDVRTYAERAELDVHAKLALVAEIADAIEHAHTKGVVHRDLKPDNVLVGENGRPKVLDFGIARVTDDSTLMRTAVTETGQLIGTLNYMAPEQLDEGRSRIGAMTDVYALGVVLFELLSGRRPHEISGLALAAAVRVIADEEAPRLGRWVPGVARDVETIVGKALEKDPERRYATAGAFAADLRRFLKHEPITARPPSAIYIVRRFTQRHRGAVLGLTAAVLALLVGVAFSLRFALQSRTDKNAAVREAAHSSLTTAGTLLGTGDPAMTRAHLESVPKALRNWEWNVLSARAAPKFREVPDPTERGIFNVAFGHTRPVLAVTQCRAGNEEGDCWIVDTETGELLEEFSTAPIRSGAELAFSPDDRELILVADSPEAHTYALTWDLRERKITNEVLLRAAGWASRVLSWDGALVALGHEERHNAEAGVYTTWIYDTRTGEELRQLEDFCWQHASFGDDGGLVASHASLGLTPVIVDLETGRREVLEGSLGYSWLAPSAARLGVATAADVYEVWDVEGKPKLVARFRGHGGKSAFSADANRIARVGNNDELYVHDVSAVRELGPFGSHDGVRLPPKFLPDGDRVVTVSDCTSPRSGARVWSLEASHQRALIGHASYVYSASSFDDPKGLGHVVATGGWDGWSGQPGCLRLWDVSSGATIGVLGGSLEILRGGLAFIPDTADLIVCFENRSTKRARVERIGIDGTPVWTWERSGTPEWLAVEPSGRRSVGVIREGVLWVVDNSTGELLLEREYGDRITFNFESPVAWSHDGQSIAVVTSDVEITILDASTFEERRVIDAHEKAIQSLAFAAQGWLLSGSSDGTARVWDTDTGERLAQLEHGRGIQSVSVRPDGSRIAIGTATGATHIWDPDTFTEIVRFTQHGSYVKELSWSLDGETLFTPSGDGTVGVWNAQSGLDLGDERRARKRRVETLEPQLDELLGDAASYEAARARIWSNAALTVPERMTALQLFVGRCWARRGSEDRAANDED